MSVHSEDTGAPLSHKVARTFFNNCLWHRLSEQLKKKRFSRPVNYFTYMCKTWHEDVVAMECTGKASKNVHLCL